MHYPSVYRVTQILICGIVLKKELLRAPLQILTQHWFYNNVDTEQSYSYLLFFFAFEE